jgi:hypothetical protein
MDHNFQIIENEQVNQITVCGVRKKKGGKMRERTLNVIENKYIRPSLRHYIHENKPPRGFSPLYI